MDSSCTVSDVRANACGDPMPVPDAVQKATIPPVRVESQKLADGVYSLGGGSHHSVAVEFRDFVAVVEAPLNEERSLAVIAEVRKLMPDKPIDYVVNTHHHFDHSGGLRTYVHEEGVGDHHLSRQPRFLRPGSCFRSRRSGRFSPTGCRCIRRRRPPKATASRPWSRNTR